MYLLFLGVALVFGGATREEVISSDIVGLAALPVLAVAIWRMRDRPLADARFPLLIVAGVIALPLIQLIPLPPGLWTMLPGRAPVVEGLNAAGVPIGWAPISLTPQKTWSSLLSLVAPVAMFLATLTLGRRSRQQVILCIIAFGAVSVLLGAAQFAGGEDSPLRAYEITNRTAAVGLFSNRNHLASLMVCVVAMASGWAVTSAMDRPVPRLPFGLALGAVALATIGAGLTGSRAGLLLLAPAGLGAVAMAWRAGVGQSRGKALLVFLGAGFLAGVVIIHLAFGEAIGRLQTDLTQDIRLIAARVGSKAILAFLPFGSGIGSFVPAYKMFEGPESVINTYINHAHNDWIEVLIEGGVLAGLLLVAFLVWFGRRSLALWRKGGADWTQQRAAALCVLLLVLHSITDYPLRTPALGVVFAFACATMLSPPGRRRTAPDAVPVSAARR